MGLYVHKSYEPREGQGVKSWFKKFYKKYGIPTTYEQVGQGDGFVKQCDKFKHRSVEDHIRLANTYYPGLSTNKILKALYSILLEGKVSLIFCDSANKWVIYRGFRNGNNNKYGFDTTLYNYSNLASKYFYTNGKGMYSAFQLYRMFGWSEKNINIEYNRFINNTEYDVGLIVTTRETNLNYFYSKMNHLPQ